MGSTGWHRAGRKEPTGDARICGEATRRPIITRNPAELAHAPKRRPLASAERRARNAQQLEEFLDLAADHRPFPTFWLAANTGMRLGELLGPRWNDIDTHEQRLSVNRALISVGDELHESRDKIRTARRTVDLDERTIAILTTISTRREPDDLCSATTTEDPSIRTSSRTPSTSRHPAPPPRPSAMAAGGRI